MCERRSRLRSRWRANTTFDLVRAGHRDEKVRYAVEGTVRWMREPRVTEEGPPPGCGIRWSSISEDALAAIRRFIRSRETLVYEE
jgi:hypothetical protein